MGVLFGHCSGAGVKDARTQVTKYTNRKRGGCISPMVDIATRAPYRRRVAMRASHAKTVPVAN